MTEEVPANVARKFTIDIPKFKVVGYDSAEYDSVAFEFNGPYVSISARVGDKGVSWGVSRSELRAFLLETLAVLDLGNLDDQ